MRGSFVGSLIVHTAAIVLLFALRASAPLIVPGPDVVQVQLVQQPIRPQPPRPQPPPEKQPEREAPKIKPVAESGVKLSEPKPVPKKAEEDPPPEPEKPPEPQVTSLPSVAVGATGLSGSMTLDSNFEFTYYLLLVRNRIAGNWTAPRGLVTGGQPVRAVVYFKIARDGSIRSAALEERSGREFFDRSTIRAVLVSDPLPPLPEGFDGTDLGVHFGFEYAGP